MLCLFNFPAYIDCNVGYRIPSFIRVEVWMVKNPLYQILQLTRVGTVFTDVFLQNAFAM